jgi:hypothetical protein
MGNAESVSGFNRQVIRFQGGERTVILVSATESDRAYLLASAGFLLDPRRLTVALSRAKRKMILVASRSIFSLFSTDEETFANSLLWKTLLLRTCSTLLWEGQRDGRRAAVRGGGNPRPIRAHFIVLAGPPPSKAQRRQQDRVDRA